MRLEPLNQFAKEKKNPKEVSVFGATTDDFIYHFCQNIFPNFFSLLHTSFMNPSFMQSIGKRNNPF